MVRLSKFNILQKGENDNCQNIKSASSYNEETMWIFAFPRKISIPDKR